MKSSDGPFIERTDLIAALVFVIFSVFVIINSETNLKYKDPTRYFKCVDGFWYNTSDDELLPVFVNPDGVVISLICGKPVE